MCALTSFLIHTRDLLKARVKIYSYNDHVWLLSPEPGGRRTTTVYSGRGNQHCYEIIWFWIDFTCTVTAFTRTWPKFLRCGLIYSPRERSNVSNRRGPYRHAGNCRSIVFPNQITPKPNCADLLHRGKRRV